MSENVDAPPAKSSKGPPKWMLFTGCGCVVPGFLLVATGAFAIQMGQKLFNQNEAYRTLAELIPFDESLRGTSSGETDDPRTPRDESRNPRDVDLIMGGEIPISGGVHAYWFGRDIPVRAWETSEFGPAPLRVSIVRIPTDQSDAATRAPQGTPLHVDTEIEIPGRTLRARRIPEMRDEGFFFRYFHGVDEMVGAGAAVFLQEGVVDESEDGVSFDLVAYFQRPGSSDQITDEEVAVFLEPFDLTPPAGEGPEQGEDAPPAETGSASEDGR